MSGHQALKRMQTYLDEQPAGAALDANTVANLLSVCWDALDGSRMTKMKAEKLGRIEQPTWNPPFLEFSIERHGQTVSGSTRATVHRWRVNVEEGTAGIVAEKRRQLYAMDKRLNVKPIAEELADAIIHGKEDARIAFTKDGAVRLKIADIVPATNNQTTASRRTRLRMQLTTMLAPHGWNELRANVYHRGQGQTE